MLYATYQGLDDLFAPLRDFARLGMAFSPAGDGPMKSMLRRNVAALEMISRQHGFRDWNTMHAAIGNRRPGPPLAVGQTVNGRYLGKPFRGEVIGVRSLGEDGRFRTTIRFDDPVNVSQFESFEVLRRQVNATVGRDGRSIERVSDGTPHMQIDL